MKKLTKKYENNLTNNFPSIINGFLDEEVGYEIAKKEGLIKTPILGQNYFEESTTGTHYLTSKELINFRRKIIAQYHLRPKYVYEKLKETGFNYTKFKNYSKYGFRLIGNLLK